MELRIEKTTDFNLDWYSNSKLVAINTCPRWGVVRFGLGKHFTGSGLYRAMPLEAGSASHDGFAACRLFELGHHQGLRDHMCVRAEALWGKDRAEQVLSHFDKHEDVDTCAVNMMLEAFYTSGFTDDPSDKRRTITNIEEALIAYHRRYPYGHHKVWVQDEKNPYGMVGVELFFDLTIIGSDDFKARYIGTIDGVHLDTSRPFIVPQENKTASRLDQSWREAFLVNNQVTGYMMAAMFLTGLPCEDCIIRGMSIPLPKGYDLGGIVDEPVNRSAHQYGEWMRWFVDGVATYRAYLDDPLSSPLYTHSCNRYFRSCSFIPLCASPYEDQVQMLEEMDTAPLSPSEQNMIAKAGD